MKIERPQKGYLYTWNFFDGFLGLPKRKIPLVDITPALLHVAYLGGGDRWDDKGTRSGALLCLILIASSGKESSTDYYKFFDNYNVKLLEEIFNTKAEELSGGDKASWSLEFNCLDWSQEKLDSTIEKILKWHTREIERIRAIDDGNV